MENVIAGLEKINAALGKLDQLDAQADKSWNEYLKLKASLQPANTEDDNTIGVDVA